MRAMREKYGLSGNALKIIALIAMTVDHIGVILLGGNVVWRIIGRISFPIFAFMIAEGCRYTKNKRQYLGTIFLLGAVCQAVYYFGEKSLYQGILITFSLSIIIFSAFILLRLLICHISQHPLDAVLLLVEQEQLPVVSRLIISMKGSFFINFRVRRNSTHILSM